MKNLSKKLMILVLALSVTLFPSLQANAQSGTIAGVSTGTLAVGAGILIAGLVIADAIDDDDDPLPIASTVTTTTTANQDSAGASTTTTN